MSWLPDAVSAVIAAVLAITLHEAAHGYAANALGDPTAKLAGRLSLNPFRHVDPVGTLALPGVLLVSQLLTLGRVEFMFGWAKPVPVDYRNLLRAPGGPLGGMALVAAAGPGINFALALAAGLAFHPLEGLEGSLSDDSVRWVYGLFAQFLTFNLVLALFNLLPIPPLDGGRILAGVLPTPLALRLLSLERFGILIVILGVFLLPRVLPGVDPFGDTLRWALRAAVRLVLALTGHATE